MGVYNVIAINQLISNILHARLSLEWNAGCYLLFIFILQYDAREFMQCLIFSFYYPDTTTNIFRSFFLSDGKKGSSSQWRFNDLIYFSKQLSLSLALLIHYNCCNSHHTLSFHYQFAGKSKQEEEHKCEEED